MEISLEVLDYNEPLKKTMVRLNQAPTELSKAIMMNSNAKNINKDIINKDIAQNNSSKKTKSASIRPIFKKDGRTNQSIYRPISLLSIFSKIYWRFILENLAVRIHVFRVFPAYQHFKARFMY